MMDWNGRPLRSTRRAANLLGARQRWYKVENLAGSGPAVVSIYDEIGMFGVSASDFVNELRGVSGRDIELHLNTPGGDVFDGIAIYNTLKQSKGQVSVIIDGLAASAGSFIAMAASPGCLEIAPHAQMMIHNGFAMAVGDAADMRKTADLLDQVTAEIAGIYADRTGKPAAHWLALMDQETWLTDQMCVAQGLADRVHGQAGPSNGWDMSVYRNSSAADLDSDGAAPWEAAGDDAPVCQTCDGSGRLKNPATGANGAMCPSCDGSGTYDPDDDGDDDSTADGDTDHDYVEPDGSPGPKARGRRPVRNDGGVDSSPWDGGKAMANGAAADDPAAFYAGICAGKKDGNPRSQSSWALPYKYHPGDAPNAAGVKNALARLPQTEGLVNAAEAKATLQAAMKKVNPDWSPDDLSETEILAMFARALASPALEGSK